MSKINLTKQQPELNAHDLSALVARIWRKVFSRVIATALAVI